MLPDASAIQIPSGDGRLPAGGSGQLLFGAGVGHPAGDTHSDHLALGGRLAGVVPSPAPGERAPPPVYRSVLHRYGPPAPEERDVASQNFLAQLEQLRTTILQDSVALREQFPDHVMRSRPVFHGAEYEDFAARVKQTIQEPELPQGALLSQAMPALRQEFKFIRQSLTDLHQQMTAGQSQVTCARGFVRCLTCN